MSKDAARPSEAELELDESPNFQEASLPFICYLPLDIVREIVAFTPLVWWTNFIRTCKTSYELYGRNDEIGSVLHHFVSLRHDSSRHLLKALKRHTSEAHILQGLCKFLRHAHTVELRGISTFSDASLRTVFHMAPNVSNLHLFSLSGLRGSIGAIEGQYGKNEDEEEENKKVGENVTSLPSTGDSAPFAPSSSSTLALVPSIPPSTEINAFEQFGTRIKSLTLGSVGIRESSFSRLFERAITQHTGFWSQLERLEMSMGLIFHSLALLPLVATSLKHLAVDGCWKLTSPDWDAFAAVLTAHEGEEAKTLLSPHFRFFSSHFPFLLPSPLDPTQPIATQLASSELLRLVTLKPRIQLTTFSAKSSLRLSDATFCAIIAYTGATITKLSLKANDPLRATSLQAIAEYCPILNDLCISDLSPLITSQHWAVFFGGTIPVPEGEATNSNDAPSAIKRSFNPPSLTYLDVSGNVNIDDEVVSKLTQGEDLKMENLNLTCSSITDASIAMIVDKYGDTLRYLDVSGCQKVTRFDDIDRLSKLVRLASAECHQLASFTHARSYAQLQSLEVSRDQSASTEMPPLRALQLAPQPYLCVQKYDLSFTDITDETINVLLRGAIHLASLSLIGCSQLTNASLMDLTSLLRQKDFAAPFVSVGLCQVPLIDAVSIRHFKSEFCPSSLALHKDTRLPDIFREKERYIWGEAGDEALPPSTLPEDRISIACARGGPCQSRFICQCHIPTKELHGRVQRLQRRMEEQ